ncbi:tRNA (guanosine(37)-N1)-methyltransferase TrmD [Ornithobacterium rhinotracheale]|uniref:tRNA (guanine-N(1)-)-methyltransferase n=1 Tax=Ornithobacterium rhinotracheale (strain ATCC 51463 / DSM 15997 / CCUG 23171 / CIP 104009 / LMG 9086) TaxID=867902 RepID=I4A3D6_ORNRL|nr:tRNA (guanosine(37)-N1)-methyltransferase TrmD [Ornithobacterium rhinotracheale]AFL98470.1 tRNA (guanine-N1)-methyltransferase [Ornithobacterium rhinotracheale DSM 15997]AIQ00197.1 tRNA (guanine-N1)-methyltransferase [Ornithobacterium rhinotracheale ORT-UMN 88]KGB65776.1 tRNA (guanine-N1)-methyltransferase [Ornithobacterium rhinotracheale H06-030791]MBN3662893.1 tRNA (guanosine(37)-N1)-methyltransferase TrmD [Ornithobacterium rhinotracheale]MCK0193181.1 tRNA (guanosine(37)-N1)-methyltransfe
MRIDIVTAVPDLLSSPFNASIMKRAQDKGLVEIHIHNLRDYATDNYKSVDDYPYGGEAGMVMKVEPIERCFEQLMSERTYDEVIYVTPDGKTFDQKMANQLSLKGNLLILCGHYKGVDQRVRDEYVTLEISVGDFVLSGGELAAALVVDAVVRLLPGVLNDETSALSDSFQDQLLAPPVYTRPPVWKGREVPAILMSGNFPKIEEWKHQQALERTQERRPDLLED